jgi:peptide/nickel transport system substrate-binding protein
MTSKNRDISMDRRKILQGMGAATVTGLAGCLGGLGNGGDQGTGLMFAQAKDPVRFDPISLNDVPSSEVADQIFEGLYAYEEGGPGHVPELATGEPEKSRNGTRWVAEIEEDATFQNGDPVTATDVKYSFLAPVEESTGNASEVDMIESVTVVDDKTAQFDLEYPYGPFRHTLHWSIVPKSVREENKQKFGEDETPSGDEDIWRFNPVGSGPFEWDEWAQGRYVRLKRNEDYWGEESPNLAEVEFAPVVEPTTRITSLKGEENDIVKSIPPQLWTKVEDLESSRIESVPGTGYFYLAFNCAEGPTTDPQVREAIDYTFSMDRAVEEFVNPTGIRQYSPLPRAVAEKWDMPVDDWKDIPHDKDIDRAKELLDDAGVPDDYTWNIIVPDDDKRENLGVTVANGLKEAGWDASTRRLDWKAFLKQYRTGKEADYNMYTLGWAGTPDPDSFTYYMFARDESVMNPDDGTNGSYWGDNSEVGRRTAEKFVQARESADREERRQLYIEGITTVLEERPHIPSYNLKESYGVNDYVESFAAHPVSQFRLFSEEYNTQLSK